MDSSTVRGKFLVPNYQLTVVMKYFCERVGDDHCERGIYRAQQAMNARCFGSCSDGVDSRESELRMAGLVSADG